MPIVYLLNHKSFRAEVGSSILDAAAAAGLALESSCRTGRCGSCRTQVLAGSSQVLSCETGLDAGQRDAGWILSCARSATTDLRLDTEDLGAVAHLRRQTLPCRVDTLQRLAPDVMRVVLRLPPTAPLERLSGQYVNVIGRGGLRRSYSVANAPAAAGTDAATGANRLELHVRRVPGGAMSAYWFEQARANDVLRIDGPLGTFFLRDGAGRDLVFLATGTGLAPVQAMLADLASTISHDIAHDPAPRPRSVTLLWGGRSAQDLYTTPALPSAPGWHYVPVLSRAGAGWRGATGHVQDVLLAMGPELTRCTVYACGSPTMTGSARVALLAAGLPARHFHADAFVNSGDAEPASPPSH